MAKKLNRKGILADHGTMAKKLNRKGILADHGTMAKKLNRKGILALADDLVAHKQRYNQNRFGDFTDCGTVCCLAGFCYAAEIGTRKFNELVKSRALDDDACVRAGLQQLGIEEELQQLGIEEELVVPQVFLGISDWPDDLAHEYYENGPKGRVVVALKALSRLNPDGTIGRKVRTRIPQLAELLATKGK